MFDFFKKSVDKRLFADYNQFKHLFGIFVRKIIGGTKMTAKRRIIIRVIILAIIIFAVIFGGVIIRRNVAAASVGQKTRYYTSVQLRSGDSLWSIADRYCPDGVEIRSYIEELRRLNGIENDRALSSDSYISVYYYK